MGSELPLLVFTVLTGLASGGYVLGTVYGLLDKRRKRSWAFSLLCLVALGIGMLGSLAHLGHPERFLNALANPSAMITQEAYWSIAFGCVLLVDTLLLKIKGSHNKVVPVVGPVLGLGLMTVTSIAYFTSYGVAGWAEAPTLFLFIVGDLALGSSLAIAFPGAASDLSDNAGSKEAPTKATPSIAIALYLALAVVFVAEAVVFAGLAVGPWGFVAAAVVALIACALQMAEMLRKAKGASIRWICFSLVALSVIISRCAFFAMA